MRQKCLENHLEFFSSYFSNNKSWPTSALVRAIKNKRIIDPNRTAKLKKKRKQKKII